MLNFWYRPIVPVYFKLPVFSDFKASLRLADVFFSFFALFSVFLFISFVIAKPLTVRNI
jgi:hypothetical protein